MSVSFKETGIIIYKYGAMVDMSNKQVIKPASGKFSLRIDPKECAQLAQIARQRKISINALVRNFITDKLNAYQKPEIHQ